MNASAAHHVPVTLGSPEYRSVDTRSGVVTHAWFPPGTALPPHTHDRPIVAVMLEGGFRTSIARRNLECTARCVWTEPLGERHANAAGAEGARVVVLQPDPALRSLFEPVERLLQDVSLHHDVRVAAAARTILSEIQFEDSVSPLAIDAIMMQMLATTARLDRDTKGGRAVPAWLSTVQELLHARFRERVTLTELAAAAGVHPCHLSRSFRRHFRVTIGDYVRRLRAEWAAELLERTHKAISEIAYEAGYSDQSHLTRECRRHFGLGPAEYRRGRRR